LRLLPDSSPGRQDAVATTGGRVRFDREAVLLASYDGVGAQYNQNVYAERSRAVGITDAAVGGMEERMTLLAPQIVRVFYNADALADPDLLQSFRRTVKLAQRTGGAINVTLQGLGPKVLHAHPRLIPLFAEEVAGLITDGGISKLRWLTLRNEPNDPSAPLDKALYARCYVDLDAELRRLGVRARVRLMGGDLRSESQRAWFTFIAGHEQLRTILDDLSIHVYWDYVRPAKITARLEGVLAIRKSLEAIRRKPFYVMEYGVRGIKTQNGVTEDPGFFKNAGRIADSRVNAFQRAWFALMAAKTGYRGVVAWDAYFAKYDAGPRALMHYSLVAGPRDDEPWRRRHAFRALRLLMRAVEPGWRAVEVTGGSATQCVVGFVSPDDRDVVSVVGLDTAGARLDTASPKNSTYAIAGLPPSRTFQLSFWNRDGDGLNSFDDTVRSDAGGTVTVSAPIHSVFALTTRQIS